MESPPVVEPASGPVAQRTLHREEKSHEISGDEKYNLRLILNADIPVDPWANVISVMERQLLRGKIKIKN